MSGLGHVRPPTSNTWDQQFHGSSPHLVADPLLQFNATAIAECPNYWLPREDIEAGRCRTAAEQAVAHLHTCLRGRLPERWMGAEFWVQRYDGGRGLGFVSRRPLACCLPCPEL